MKKYQLFQLVEKMPRYLEEAGHYLTNKTTNYL